MTTVPLDRTVAEHFLRYARMVVARGYIHNTLGNMAVRVPVPGFEHGVAYTKHAEIGLEDMTIDNVVITDIPTGRLLHGTVPTSVGHQLNREILRLRPDVGAVIHCHHDETIALFASGVVKELREAYHRLNTLTSEVRRVLEAERLAALRGTEVHYIEPASVEWMYGVADAVIYPSKTDPATARSTVKA